MVDRVYKFLPRKKKMIGILLWMAFCQDPFEPVETAITETKVPKIVEMTRHM